MASTAVHPLFFNDESVSLRSFRVNALSPSPPSLKASSLKQKGSLALSNLLGSRGRKTEKYPQPTLRDLTEISYREADQAADFLVTSPESSKMPHVNANGTAQVQTEQATLQRPRSKSRTMIRMLTTKFTPRAVSPPTVVRTPPPMPNDSFKDQRDAALRERGLLPPLRPNQDLSAQEFERDQHIPIVQLVDGSVDHSEEGVPSAADLVKKEWAAKNQGVEVGRMNSFKFGGGSSPVASSPSEETRLPLSLAAGDQVPSPMADKPTSPPNEPLPPVPSSPEEPVPQQLPSSSMNALSIPLSPVECLNRPPSPLIELPAEIHAFMFPPPPTPPISTTELAFRPRSPTALITPRSPSLRSVPDAPRSVKSSAGGSGANTPRPLEVREISTLTQSTGPLISLTPATEISIPPMETAPANDAFSSAFRARSDSFAQQSIASDTTPSLDSTSQTTANSTTGSPDQDSASNSLSAAKGPGKLGMLQVKTHEGAAIPVIVQSPTRFSDELAIVVEESSSLEFGELNEKSENPTIVAATAVPQSPTAPVPLAAGRRPPKRGQTDPTGTVDRRRSLNPFKRGQTVVKRSVSPNAGAQPQRRPSMVTSLSSIRRSVVGTISGGSGKKFDASSVPPSPTLPRNFVSSRTSTLGSPPPTARVRQAVAPIMYNSGSILQETAGIEDEETRRMTELAFLG